MKRRTMAFSMACMVALALTGCGAGGGNSASSSESGGESEAPGKLTKVTHVTSWYAQPEQGGQYAAIMKGFYEESGLDVTIEPGGPKVSPAQIVGSGKAQFGMGQSDLVLQARDQGIPLVAIGAILQRSPHALIYHKSQDIDSFEDLNGRTLYLSPALSYWDFVQNKYNLDQVQIMTYDGTMASFINDEESVVQGYMTSEPYQLQKAGVEVEYLDIYDSGFAPYATTIFTTEQFMKENPDAVKAFMEATVKGWEYYKDHAEEVNTYLLEYNPDLQMDEMENTTKMLDGLIYTGDALTQGVGYMSEERWVTLQEQLLETGVIKNKEDIANVFTNEFLPGS